MRYGVLFGTAIVFLAGCSGLPKYVQPASGGGVAVVNSYSNLVLCRITGPAGPGKSHACRAHVAMVDKHYAGFHEKLRIAPGEREVFLNCFVVGYGDGERDTAFGELVRLKFSAGDNITAVPYWEGDVCKVRLQDESGNDVPFERVSPPPAQGA